MCKKKHKNKCCCMCNNQKNVSDCCNRDNGPIEAILFWLIACGSGLLNNNSVLIVLLFLLFGFSNDNLGCMFS